MIDPRVTPEARRLRDAIQDAVEATPPQINAAGKMRSVGMKAFTVLGESNDPFRMGTDGPMENGSWLADKINDLGITQPIHVRGLHYRLVGANVKKPDGAKYVNSGDDWQWLQRAQAAARWLGYVPFEMIIDQRNDAPIVKIFEPPVPTAEIYGGYSLSIPSLDSVAPEVDLTDFRGTQPYKIIMVGEKSSLEPVLGPIARAHEADLYLQTGYASTTHTYQIAKNAVIDQRPIAVLYFADADPWGWDMPIAVARKLQALQYMKFQDQLEFVVHRVALTPEQVRNNTLPDNEIDPDKKRGKKWTETMGIGQVEIDALVADQEGQQILADLANEACRPYFDGSLADRVEEAREAWTEEAQEILDENVDLDRLQILLDRLRQQLLATRDTVNAVNEIAVVDPDDLELPEIEIPEADPALDAPTPLIDSEWDFRKGTLALKRDKAYD